MSELTMEAPEALQGPGAPAASAARTGATTAGARPVGGPGVRLAGSLGVGVAVTGVLFLLFSAFQFWGTGLLEQRSQRELEAQFDRALQAQQAGGANAAPYPAGGDPAALDPAAPVPTAGDEPPHLGRPAPPAPAPVPGEALARITAPTIDLEKTVVEGVGRFELELGPGHYPISALPGHAGNVAIAGHRTTHGSPFGDLDQLQPGDPIILETVEGRFTYRVTAQVGDDGTVAGHRIVAPDTVDVIADQGDARLTLTSCHPRRSNRQRLVVTALLEGPALPAPVRPPVVRPPDEPGLGGLAPGGAGERPVMAPATAATRFSDEPLGWRWDELDEVVTWALLTVAASAPALVLFRRRRRWLSLLLALIGPIVPLFICFIHLDHLLPAY